MRCLPVLALVGLAAMPSLTLGQSTEAAESGIQAARGWSAEGLAAVEARATELGTGTLVVVTRGTVVLQMGPLDHKYRAHSLRKSFLSALLGIAAARGEIDLEANLRSLGINDRTPLSDSEQDATVLQLMQSRSGVYHPAASETPEMAAARLPRGAHQPGAHWHYNNWDFNALGTIFRQQTGTTVGQAFAERIAAPVGMEDFLATDVRDQSEAEKSEHAAYKFRISARDLVRFGQLYLNGGRWHERHVIPAEWISESTRLHSATGNGGSKSGYGLMWWVTAADQPGLRAGTFTASGTGGQRLTVVPAFDTVIVHLMDTDRRSGPRIGSRAYDELLRHLFAARLR